MDGDIDLGVTVIQYHPEATWWPGFCKEHNLGQIPLQRLNAGEKHEGVQWTPRLIERVGEFFSHDIEKFGYKPPAPNAD